MTTTAALAFATPAMAAPDRAGTLSATATKFEWDGGPGNGLQGIQDCGAPTHTCDATLLKVDTPGTLVVTPQGGPTAPDLDIYVYYSDAAGTQGDLWASSASSWVAERASGIAEAGYYLVVVDFYGALQGTYHGVAELTTPDVEWAPTAPARHFAMNAGTTSKEWDGTGHGAVFDCGEVSTTLQPCDHTLIHVTEPGSLNVDTAGASDANKWDYLVLYQSDAAGSKSDDAVLSSASGVSANQTVATFVEEPGYYLVEVGFLVAPVGDYHGTARFEPSGP